MNSRLYFTFFISSILVLFSNASHATNGGCQQTPLPQISFVQFDTPNIDRSQPTPNPLKMKGKLTLPVHFDRQTRCFVANSNLRAVVILHGSAGVDSRGAFYSAALNAAGIATLEIDMWEARGVTGLSNRPQLPIFTHPDAFSALGFLRAHPNIAADHIGVLGFSWGGVTSLAAAENLYAGLFGGGPNGARFKAHAANYPVCYGANNGAILPPGLPPANAGTQFRNLTGAPILIQIGSEDDYDNGSAHCRELAANHSNIELIEYQGAFHAWDRIMIPVTTVDPFANEGSFFTTGVLPKIEIKPDVEQAYASRKRVLGFFLRNL